MVRNEVAVVLGGGGVTGIAWESGIIASLKAMGIYLWQADMIFGNSAGSFVGAALASGYDMQQHFDHQMVVNPDEKTGVASKDIILAWRDAFIEGGTDAEAIERAMGNISKTRQPQISLAEREAVAKSRLETLAFPDHFGAVSVDRDTGKTHVLTKESGVSLVQATCASGAVPGVWPSISFNGIDWIDGGMVSSANPLLAKDYRKVLVIAPLPIGYGQMPSTQEEVAELSKTAKTFLFVPDAHTKEVVGKGIYDADRAPASGQAGWDQALNVKDEILAFWRA
ncbi:hypothetical protein AYR62_13350 [Secundilactobacillus paracollinoides]|uniref:patatin-like phospholipase family protein n=1 Tax=Secundilactobacillus paracollinoides TaxID=240427 RepID=UPI00081A9C12|nr:patatin-like phospholipase family protein [Secundilactobacillus paracollinoides]ANZ64962.1 hypothetical protein AYR62_13350 [Secundilactobacillus paracollinoides]